VHSLAHKKTLATLRAMLKADRVNEAEMVAILRERMPIREGSSSQFGGSSVSFHKNLSRTVFADQGAGPFVVCQDDFVASVEWIS
jgi:hypothetical protein